MGFQGHELLYNAAAHFAASEKYEEGIINAINADFAALCWALGELSAQAEAMNRYMKLKAKRPLDADELALTMRPRELIEARIAVMQAVSSGLSTDEDDDSEVDETLAEIEKKTESV